MAIEARRDFILKTIAGGLYAATYSAPGLAQTRSGIPGPFPGRVIAVERQGAVVERQVSARCCAQHAQ